MENSFPIFTCFKRMAKRITFVVHPLLLLVVELTHTYIWLYCQELKARAADALHRVDELLGLSQSMLSVVKDSPTKSGVKQKLHRLNTSLQRVDSELGVSTVSWFYVWREAVNFDACNVTTLQKPVWSIDSSWMNLYWSTFSIVCITALCCLLTAVIHLWFWIVVTPLL